MRTPHRDEGLLAITGFESSADKVMGLKMPSEISPAGLLEMLLLISPRHQHEHAQGLYLEPVIFFPVFL